MTAAWGVRTGQALNQGYMSVCSVAQSSLTLLQPHGPPGSSVHGVSQARILERVAISYFMGSFQPRGRTHVSCISCIGRRILYR